VGRGMQARGGTKIIEQDFLDGALVGAKSFKPSW